MSGPDRYNISTYNTYSVVIQKRVNCIRPARGPLRLMTIGCLQLCFDIFPSSYHFVFHRTFSRYAAGDGLTGVADAE